MGRLKVASLFCGCGGMDLGILGGFDFLDTNYPRSAFDIVYAVDNDPYCTKIYNANFEHKCQIKDVRDISPDEMPDFDLLIGGFPCQGFSVANTKRSMKDERNFLYKEMLRVIKDKNPKFFVAENVKGILSMEKGKVIEMIKKDFESLGYKVDARLLNAAEYGVPQARERVVIIGNRLGLENPYPTPTHWVDSN